MYADRTATLASLWLPYIHIIAYLTVFSQAVSLFFKDDHLKEGALGEGDGYIKLWRKTMENPIIWKTCKHFTVFCTLLMMANYRKKQWIWENRQYICEPGELITSYKSMLRRTAGGVTMQNLRTILQDFVDNNIITRISTNESTKIKIINWEQYQCGTHEDYILLTEALTRDQHTPNKRVTTNKKDKKDKNNIYTLEMGKKTPNQTHTDEAREVLLYLNDKTNHSYRETEANKKIICARLKDGYRVADFKRIVDNKLKDPYFIENPQFYRVKTLFAKSHFDDYLNETHYRGVERIE